MNSHLPQNLDERLELTLTGLRGRQIAKFPDVRVNFPADPVEPSMPDRQGYWHRPGVRRVAAAVMMCVTIGVVLSNFRGGGAGVVLADVIQCVVQAKSVTFVMKEQIIGKTSKEFRCWMQGDGLRIEGTDNSTLIENGAGAVLLDRKSKQAARVPTSTEERKDPVPSPIEQLRLAKSDNATFVGKEVIDGSQTSKFQMPVKDASLFHNAEQYGFGAELQLTVWVDVETKLPVRIEIRHPKEAARIVFEGLKWNETLDAPLFNTTIPSDFIETSELLRGR